MTDTRYEEENMSRRDKNKKKKSSLREKVEVIVTALVLAFLIKTFVVGNFWIPSESMVPTIEEIGRAHV